MGNETGKCFEKRRSRGDFERFLSGRGLDIGAGGDPLRAPNAIVDAWDKPQGDAQELRGVADGVYDFVYSSHCLEHVRSVEVALQNWTRVLKPGGHLYFVVPDYSLYEKGVFPSKFNSDHKHSFSLRISRKAINRANHWNISEDITPLLKKLGVQVSQTFLEDDNYDYCLSDEIDQTHFCNTLAQICIIARKDCLDPISISGICRKPEIISDEHLRIYTGILGQIGDIVMFTPTARRLKELFPNSKLTFAISQKYQQAGALIADLPYIDRVFVTQFYFERLTQKVSSAWYKGWPVDLRGDDEINEQRCHDIVLETRPRSRRFPWWNYAHQVEETAHRIGVPGPLDLQTDIAISSGASVCNEVKGKIVIHNDPSISKAKAWRWDFIQWLVGELGPSKFVLLGNPGNSIDGVIDYRGKTNLAQAAEIIATCQCYVGIDSGLMWIAASLQVPVVGLYGTAYIPAYSAIYPRNPNATYLQAEGPTERISAREVLEELKKKLNN
jgi:SAM-dependent methyltransferase